MALGASPGGAAGGLGRGQDADAQGHGRPAAAGCRPCAAGGPHPVRCGAGHQPDAAAAPGGLSVPGLCAVSAPDGAPEYRLWPAAGLAQSACPRTPARGGAMVGCPAHHAAGRSDAVPALGRPAPARGPGPCPGGTARRLAAGRTVFGAGSGLAPGLAQRTGRSAAPPAAAHGADHPRSRRCTPAGRAHHPPAGRARVARRVCRGGTIGIGAFRSGA